MAEGTAVQLTGPQLEVIALLAEGVEVTLIAALTRGTVHDVHDTIWAACRALDAKDRTHLVAEAFRAGLLRVPGIEQLRADAAQAAETITMLTQQRDDARQAATVAEAKLQEAPAAPAPAADPDEVTNLRKELRRANQAAGVAIARAERVEQQLAIEKLQNTPMARPRRGADPLAGAIAHLEQLARQARDAARRGGIPMVHTAKGVELAAAALRRTGGA